MPLDGAKDVGFTDAILEVANGFFEKDVVQIQKVATVRRISCSCPDDEGIRRRRRFKFGLDEDALEIISHRSRRKTMAFKDDTPYYNVDKDHIFSTCSCHFYYQDSRRYMKKKEPY